MYYFLKYASYLGLALSVLPSFLVFTGQLRLDTYYPLMTGAMLLWFIIAIGWIRPGKTGG